MQRNKTFVLLQSALMTPMVQVFPLERKKNFNIKIAEHKT